MKNELEVYIQEIEFPQTDSSGKLEKIKEIQKYTTSQNLSVYFATDIAYMNATKGLPSSGMLVTIKHVQHSITYFVPTTKNNEKYIDFCKISFLNQIKALRHAASVCKVDSRYSHNHDYMYHKIGGVLVNPGSIEEIDFNIRRRTATRLKRPETEAMHVGLEIEFYSNNNSQLLVNEIARRKLHKKMRVMSDGSIMPPSHRPNGMELCVLTTEESYPETLSEIDKLLEFMDAGVNLSCGLHVHLDARFRDYRKMYGNLIKAQELLFKIADSSRVGNQYCQFVTDPNWDTVSRSHYNAISRASYDKHRTIEIRIHEGTTNVKIIESWIKLLLKIANYDKEIVSADLETVFSEEMNQYLNEKVS